MADIHAGAASINAVVAEQSTSTGEIVRATGEAALGASELSRQAENLRAEMARFVVAIRAASGAAAKNGAPATAVVPKHFSRLRCSKSVHISLVSGLGKNLMMHPEYPGQKSTAVAIAAALLESEKRFSEITETSLQAKLVHRHYKPLFANTAFLNLMGFTSKEQLLACSDLLPLFDPQTQADPLTALSRVLNGPPMRTRVQMHRRTGEPFLADAYARAVIWDDEPAVALAILDVTAEDASRRALAMAKAEAESASRAKRRFLSAASHGLRTPLHAAMGRLQLLQRANLHPDHADMADEAMRACHRLLHHVDDVLDSAAIETGELRWTKEAFRPIAAIQEGLRIARDSVEGVSIDLTVEGDPEAELIGDDRRTQRIALALAEEAISRGPLGPIEVQVCVDAEGLSIILRAACATACAIHDDAATGPINGMSVARMLSAAMGGVMVERNPGDHAWSVTVFLPFPPVVRTSPARQTEDGPRGARILIVEDNAGNRRLLHVILASLGQVPIAVSNGAEGVAEAARRGFDLILMDLSMPGMDGFEATRRIRRLPEPFNRTPILALTASSGADMRERAQEAGMDGFLQKPIEIAKLAAAIALFIKTPGGAGSVDATEIEHVQGQNDNEKGDDGIERHALASPRKSNVSAGS